MQWRMFITYILMFFCSYVWIKSNHMVLPCRHSWPGPGIWCSWTVGCLFYRKHLCRHLDKIPGLGQGWRYLGHFSVVFGCIPYSSVHQECGARHCKCFAWWTGGCADGSLLMYAQTNEHHLHSYVLLFLCLNKKNYHVVLPCRHSWPGPGIWYPWTAGCVLNYSRHCAVIWIRSLVLARDDAVGELCTYLWFISLFLKRIYRNYSFCLQMYGNLTNIVFVLELYFTDINKSVDEHQII